MCTYYVFMKNVTLSMDEELIRKGRQYAARHSTTLNSLIRDLLRKTVQLDSENWVDSLIEKLSKIEGHSEGKRWTREDLYDV